MIKRITKLGWVTIILIIFLIVTGMSHLTESKPKPVANQLHRQTEVQPKEQIPSKYPDIQLLLETKITDEYRLSVETPVTKSSVINDEIKQWITERKNQFSEDVNEDNMEENHTALHITLTLDKVTESYYQIHFTKEINERINQTTTFNVDIDNERILTLDDVFQMNDNTVKTITDLAKENKGDNGISDEQLDDILADSEKWEWDINRDTFTLYMNPSSKANQDKQPISIDIPIDSLYLNFNEDIADIIDMPEDQQQEMADAIQSEKERIAREKKRKENLAAKEKAKQEERAKNVADPDGKYVALTFDDGPSAEVTPQVLNTLAEHDAVATFFMLGTEVDTYPDVAKQVADAGHEIGNHTKDHQDLTTLDPDGIRAEVGYTSDRIHEVTGKRPYLVRSPYGAYNDAVLQDIAENDNSLALWSVDSLDWKSQDKNAVYHEILNNVTSGSIVLMHDIHASTADALPDLLTTLEEKGYQFVTVSQLLELQGLDGVGPHYGHVK